LAPSAKRLSQASSRFPSLVHAGRAKEAQMRCALCLHMTCEVIECMPWRVNDGATST
jgi:hypothetical protein